MRRPVGRAASRGWEEPKSTGANSTERLPGRTPALSITATWLAGGGDSTAIGGRAELRLYCLRSLMMKGAEAIMAAMAAAATNRLQVINLMGARLRAIRP